ncbi:TolC family protein [Gracilimonas sp.]|uniref:TolC family protein n=1 Tax=Gracilimonas sp. TaxID=1974203 RepID=UPI003BA9C9F9
MKSEQNKTSANYVRTLRSLRLVIMVVLVPFSLVAQSIEVYQQEAAENNPEVRAAFQQYLSSLEEEPQVGVLPDPEIAFAYFISPIETRLGPQQARISLTQMFPWFGSLSDKRSISEARAKATYEVFQEARNRLFFQTERSLLELYELERSLEIANENLDILNSLVEISLRRYETVQASQVDVLRAQIEQEDLKTQIALLEDNRKVLIRKVHELLNTEEERMVVLPDTIIAEISMESKPELMNKLVRQNPALNRLRYQEDSAKQMKALAAKDGNPTFGVGLDYIFTGERPGVANLADNGKDAIMARASFRIPLFRDKYNAKVQQAKLNIQSVQSQITDKENKLETSLTSSLRDFYDAQRRYELYDQKQIQRVEQALNIMTQKYATDSSNFEEILRMQRKLLDYQLSRIQALVDMQVSAAYIDYLTGSHNINLNK